MKRLLIEAQDDQAAKEIADFCTREGPALYRMIDADASLDVTPPESVEADRLVYGSEPDIEFLYSELSSLRQKETRLLDLQKGKAQL